MLHLAVSKGNSQIVKMLLDAGSNPLMHDAEGETARERAYATADEVCIALLEAAVAEPQRPRLLLKARALIDAPLTIETARTNARDKEGLGPAGQQEQAVAAVPLYLKQRVAQEQALPVVEVVNEQESEEIVACVKYALGLEDGGGVVLEGQEPAVGMVKELFVELCEMMVPKWARDEM